MQAVILAAGKGQRIGSITHKRSKAMLPILGKPILQRLIEHFASNEILDIIIVITPHDRFTPRYFRHQPIPNVDIRFVYQENPSGTADALKYAVPLIESDFFLSACDNLVPPDHITKMILKWQEIEPLNALLTLLEVNSDEVNSTGIVETDGDRIVSIIEKPAISNAPSNIASIPLYCFNKRILEFLPQVTPSERGECEIQSAIQMLIEKTGGVRGIYTDKRITINTPQDLLAANQHFLTSGYKNPQVHPHSVGIGSQLKTPLYIAQGTVIGSNCEIGPNVYIEADCIISDNVKIQNSVILRDASIPTGARIEDDIIS